MAMARRIGIVAAVLVGVCGLPTGTAAVGAADGTVVINEIHYHPPQDGHDFLELHNPGDTPVDIGGACFTAGIGGCFAPGTTLAAGGYLVAAESPADYATAFPGAPAAALDFTGGLSNGGETVTLGLGGSPLDTVTYSDSSPWPASPDGAGPSLELIDPLDDNDVASAWAASDPAPTPGARNTRYGQGPVPVIGDVTVGTVTTGSPTTVTAAVTGAATVELEVTIGFAAPQMVAMADDGAHGDGPAGDGTYGARIPGQPANTLVRYRVVASSDDARATVPDAGDARPRLGFVVAPPDPPTALPLLQWFIVPADLATLTANIHTNLYVPAVVTYGTQVWDGAEVRGQGNDRGANKLNFKFKMPKAQPLVAPDLVAEPIEEFVIDGDRRDPLATTTVVGLDVYAERNPFVPQRAKVRVHRNGSFLGLYTFLEEWEDAFFGRAGLDQPGTEIYEPEDVDGLFVDEGSPDALGARFEKLAGSGTSYANLHALVQAIDGPPTAARAARLRDLFDTPALVEFLATGAILQHWDQTVHNFVVIRDPATGRWRFGPNDLDYTLGLPMRSTTTGDRHRNVFPFGPADLVSALRTDPVFSEMYFRRLRTLADELLVGGAIEARADALAPTVKADADQDRVRYGLGYTATQARTQLAGYVDFKTDLLLTTHRRAGEVPGPPTGGLPVVVSELAYAATGGPGHDLVELHNPSTETMDLSGWTLSGAATATLPPGTVLPARGFLVVPGDQEATAGARPSGTLVAGELTAGVADGGGTVVIHDAGGAVRGQAAYGTTAPWPTAPAAGTATLERVDPATPGPGPSSWRASSTPTGSPGGSGNPPDPAPAHRMAVEASADQVETRPGDGSGVGFTVVVTNTGTAARPAVTVTASGGATCPGRIGTLAPGTSFTLRCRSQGQATLDRTYRFTATSGSVVTRSAPLQVRTLQHVTQYRELYLPAAPTRPEATSPGGGRIDLRWTPPAAAAEVPPRWVVVTECEPGTAVPSGGTLRPPGSSAGLDHLPLDRPVQLAVAVRNQSGTGPRTPPTPVLTPRATAVFPFADRATLIRRFVTATEGRPPTSAEITWWNAVLDGGSSPSRIVTEALAGPRWAGQVAPVARLYTAYFGRLPDQAGLQYWLARRRAGVGLDAVSSAFAGTPEFRTQYGSLSDAAFVSQLYRNVFGREPDAAGRSYWVGRIATGTPRGRVVTLFSESPEGRLLLAPMVQTGLVWTALTGTTPRPAESRPAVDWLAGGGSLLTVVEGLRTSDRYRDHAG